MKHSQASIAYASLNLAMICTIHERFTEINLKIVVSDHTWFKAAGRNDEETSIIVTYTVIVTACAASFVIIAIVRTFHLIESPKYHPNTIAI